MATISFTNSLTRLQSTNRLAIILTKPWSFRSSSKPSQAKRCYASKFDGAAKQGCDAAKKGVDAAKKTAQDLKKNACAAANNAGGKINEAAGKMGTADDAAQKVKQAAQDAAGKVQQSAEGAWGSVKDTTQKIKETVAGKADGCAKDGANKVNRAFKSDK